MEMPELEEEDAKRLFLHHATSGVEFSSDYNEEDILDCVRQCKFRKGANMDEHFHPLALKVLGAHLGSLGLDPKTWVENLSERDKFNQFGEREDPLSSVLRKGYDSLRNEDQLLFMDSVLIHLPRNFQEDNRWEWMNKVDIYKWLSIVHCTKVKQIMDRLQGLKAKSLLEDIGDGFHGVSIHDLYIEFAKLEVKRDDSYTRHWVWYDKEEAYPDVLAKTPPGHCWGNLERVLVRYDYDPENKCIEWRGTIEGIKWQHFSNVVVVQLLIGANEVLDLRSLRCLRSLHLEWKQIEDEYDFGKGEGKLDGLGELKNLGWLHLCNIHYAPCIEEIGCLTTLKVLWLHTNCSYDCGKEALSPPKLDKCIHLQELVLVQCGCLKAIPDLSKLTSLRVVVLNGCMKANEVVGLNPQMHELRELVLIKCFSLCHVLGLEGLVSLQRLQIEYSPQLQEDLNLHKLTNLHRLSIRRAFNKVLGFNESIPLEELVVSRVQELLDLHLLSKLQQLSIEYFSGSMLPRFGKFIALEKLKLSDLPELQYLPDMQELSRLRTLEIQNAPILSKLVALQELELNLVLQVPILGKLVALQELELHGCGTSVGIVELPDLHRLRNLQVLNIINTPIRSLPSLKCLAQLRKLDCSRTHLAELPYLSGLKSLTDINLSKCDKLMSIGNIANLPALVSLCLQNCHQLTTLDDLANLPALKFIFLCGCHQLTSLGILANLPALTYLDIRGCDKLQRLPDLSSSLTLVHDEPEGSLPYT